MRSELDYTEKYLVFEYFLILSCLLHLAYILSYLEPVIYQTLKKINE